MFNCDSAKLYAKRYPTEKTLTLQNITQTMNNKLAF